MTQRMRHSGRFIIFLGVSVLVGSGTTEARAQVSPSRQAGPIMSLHARGTFDVKLAPRTEGNTADSAIGQMSLDKAFHGDLAATSKGEMLAAMTSISGSAGYVAIERVVGTLAGQRGSFVLQHSGTLNRGAQELKITVVPDSGTDQLVGLSGIMTITIADGVHSYDFAYTITPTPTP